MYKALICLLQILIIIPFCTELRTAILYKDDVTESEPAWLDQEQDNDWREVYKALIFRHRSKKPIRW